MHPDRPHSAEFHAMAAAAPTPYADSDAMAAVAGALLGLGAFSEISLASQPEAGPLAADRPAAAVIVPGPWVEADDTDPGFRIHSGSYQVALIVRDTDPWRRLRGLEALTRLVQSVIEGTDLGGGCLSTQTRLSRGTFVSPNGHPEQRVLLEGRYVYRRPVHG